jgi:hypothetical protein
MSRTTLCATTAAVLAVTALAFMTARHAVLGDEVTAPGGAGTWKVTLAVHGSATGTDARLTTVTPLELGHQHVLHEAFKSAELADAAPTAKQPARRQVIWSPRGGVGDGPFRTHYEFTCSTSVAHPTPTMMENSHALYAPPAPGSIVAGTGDPALSALAAKITSGLDRPEEQAEALYRYVDQEIVNEPGVTGMVIDAGDCLEHEAGDSAAKSRLLIALCHERGLHARMVKGLALSRGQEQSEHTWVEVWLHDRWLPMCPFYHHFGKLPRTYLIFGFGDHPLVRGHNIRNLDFAFLVERLAPDAETAAETSWAHRAMTFLSFQALPPPEQRLVEFLLLLPVAALIVCVYRNVIGINSFGTFAPALLGLSFRELHSLPGIGVFVSVVVCGWLMRRVLDRYHLLQVPRASFLLSLVVLVLVSAITLAGHRNLPATRYISLFPIVILTGMIERFWALESEDGTTASFKTLLSTMLIAVSISLVLSVPALPRLVFGYPEVLGIIMACQLILGRYTGYRITELYRFRHFLRSVPRLKVMP